MNAPYDLDGCIEFARRVEPLDIYWLEEPLHWYLQPADFVRLAAATSIPLAHGERELTRFTVRDFIATGAIRYVQFDSTRAAGFTEGLRVAALAEQHAVMTTEVDHCTISSALPSRDCGTVNPSVLAALRLITSSNWVGCSMGNSPGLVPLRILSTK